MGNMGKDCGWSLLCFQASKQSLVLKKRKKEEIVSLFFFKLIREGKVNKSNQTVMASVYISIAIPLMVRGAGMETLL